MVILSLVDIVLSAHCHLRESHYLGNAYTWGGGLAWSEAYTWSGGLAWSESVDWSESTVALELWAGDE